MTESRQIAISLMCAVLFGGISYGTRDKNLTQIANNNSDLRLIGSSGLLFDIYALTVMMSFMVDVRTRTEKLILTGIMLCYCFTYRVCVDMLGKFIVTTNDTTLRISGVVFFTTFIMMLGIFGLVNVASSILKKQEERVIVVRIPVPVPVHAAPGA